MEKQDALHCGEAKKITKAAPAAGSRPWEAAAEGGQGPGGLRGHRQLSLLLPDKEQ